MAENAKSGGEARSEILMSQLLAAFSRGGGALQGVAVKGLTAVLPLVEVYAARRAVDESGADDPAGEGISRGEQAVLRAAGQKAFLELLEITSKNFPAYEGAPGFSAAAVDGQMPTPHLAHLMSLAMAAMRLLGGDDDQPSDEPPEPPQVVIPPEQTLLYVATAPGEYAIHSGPLTPREIRRSAMRQRSYAPPAPMMMVSAANARQLKLAPAAEASMQQTVAVGRQTGCGCGRSTAGACGCAAGVARSPARYRADGSCESITSVSCDTRWRIRECFKLALCDLLRCVGDELCEDGRIAANAQPDFGKCLETFVCSLVTCLPDAICPPPAKPCSPCCVRPEAASGGSGRLLDPACACNYAVGE